MLSMVAGTPLPEVSDFVKNTSELHFNKKSHVGKFMMIQMGAIPSSRLWWMLRSIGHDKVQV